MRGNRECVKEAFVSKENRVWERFIFNILLLRPENSSGVVTSRKIFCVRGVGVVCGGLLIRTCCSMRRNIGKPLVRRAASHMKQGMDGEKKKRLAAAGHVNVSSGTSVGVLAVSFEAQVAAYMSFDALQRSSWMHHPGLRIRFVIHWRAVERDTTWCYHTSYLVNACVSICTVYGKMRPRFKRRFEAQGRSWLSTSPN